jgi:hypothetical protein
MRKCKIVDKNSNGSDKVDVFHSRDLDSRPSTRESLALDQFDGEAKAMFHLMRDHKEHMAPILGKGISTVKKIKEGLIYVHISRPRSFKSSRSIWRPQTSQVLQDEP